jgi:DNA-binding NtrC family response regulator
MIEAAQVLPARDKSQGAGGDSAAQLTTLNAQSPPSTLDALERQHILRVLDETGGNRERAAAILGISARTLYRKLREYERDAGTTTSAGA